MYLVIILVSFVIEPHRAPLQVHRTRKIGAQMVTMNSVHESRLS